MTEKNKAEKMTNSSKPVPMKLFAAWEVDRTPSNCIPRLCTLRITRLKVCGALGDAGGGATPGAGAGAVILAARMHSSKRTLRSNDITVPPHDVELDLCFSLQYPHFVKRDGNRLQIMLQRRKKYKNRTILGYKTLAEGVIRMDQVLQRSMDMELELTGVGGKGGAAAGQPVAKLSITGLASTPVDHDTKNNNTLLLNERGYSDEEEEGEFSSVEEADEMTYGAPQRRRAHRQLAYNKADLSYTKLSRERYVDRDTYMRSKATERDSDSELESAAAKRKGSRGKIAQRNLKQKFAALLRRFRVPEELAERDATQHTDRAQRDIDELFQELESLSCGEGDDSGPDQMDTISIGSTPKPSLRPFFSSSRSLANQEHHRHSNESEALRSSAGDERGSEGNSDGDVAAEAVVSGASVSSSPPKDTKPRRTVMEQVSRVLGDDGSVPEAVALTTGPFGSALSALGVPAVYLPSPFDTKPLLQALTSRVNKLNARRQVRVVICGSDPMVSATLRAHTEVAARRPLDLPTLKFYIVPTGPSTVSRYISASDPGYGALFTGEVWNGLCERGSENSPADRAEVSSRIARYLNSMGPVTNMPIGEAMVAYRDKSVDEDSSQIFIPFIAEVRLGCAEGGAGAGVGAISSLEGEECGSPPARSSPPTTPLPDVNIRLHEHMELQVDYWLNVGGVKTEGAVECSKVTLKAAFKALLVTRHNSNLSLTYVIKEKKQKIMRLGKKKERSEAEIGRTQTVDGIARLICSAKTSHHAPLKVYIDGTEWNGVKFFQLSTQWQTHVKTFPVVTSGAPLAPPET